MERILLDTGPSERGAHRLELALKCPALYAYQRLLKHPVANGDRGPLTRGTIGHVALAHHYTRLGCEQRGLDPDAYYTPHDAIDRIVAKIGPNGRIFQQRIHDVYDAYSRFYAIERQKVEAVEYLVEVQVPNPFALGTSHRFTQRWDLVLEDGAGRFWVHDHKFVSKIEKKTLDRYKLSIQFVGMQWTAAKLLGNRFGGIKVNLIGVGNGDAKDFQFVCAALPPAPDAVRRFPEQVAHAERIIAETEALPDPWGARRVFSETVCTGPYGPCSAYDLCSNGKGYVLMDGTVL